MSRKITCDNKGCKHNNMKKGCLVNIKINKRGKCQSFEKGFIYYIRLVWDALGNKNFIDVIEMTADLRIGLYYVMQIYDLGFSEMEWGSCRLIMLKDGETGAALKYEDIIKRDTNEAKFYELYTDFYNGIIPGQSKQQKKSPEAEEKADLDYGWVSPGGDFTESPFGSHEESAEEISRKRGWEEDYSNWRHDQRAETLSLYRDFLIYEKGYCLIHNPTGAGGYIVTNVRPLTKKQREFLYGYFIDKGDRFKAEQYLGE